MGGCASSLRDKSSHLVNSFILIHRSAPNGTSDSIEKIASAKINFKPKKEVAQIELTETVVQEYVALEKAIYKLERSNVVKKHESKMIFADDIKKSVDQLEATYKELKKQTEKERVDVENIEQPSVKSFLMQQGTWQQRFDKEQQEYLDCLNKQEVAEKELKNAQMQYDRASKISDIYKRQCDTLNELHDKQDNMLLGIFGPEYASTKENQLEAELDDALEWQQRISLAKFKWTNGRVLLVHASTQMAFGITRWKELEQIEPSNTRMRYFAAAEARNNFLAAGQNIQSCRVYLGRVKFPYATEEEMTLMEQAIQNAFNDIQSNASLQRAHNVYQSTHKKVASLIQWFDKVINDTILKDLDKSNTNVVRKQRQLREERLELMKKKVREQFGRELDVTHDEHVVEESEEELLALEAEQVKDAEELPGSAMSKILNLSEPQGRSPTPVPIAKLAPTPTMNALFGDVRQRITEYEDSRMAIRRRNESMREKQRLSLQEKLRLRQQQKRRTRKQRRKSTIVPILRKENSQDSGQGSSFT